jgi:hypothetical protein
MNYLLAKTKGKNGDFFKVISDCHIFNLPEDLSNIVEYNSDYKLDEDQWFGITEFSKKPYCIDFLTRHFVSTEYNQITILDYSNIAYLVEYQTGVYYFQKLSSSQIVEKKFFEISTEPFIIDNKRIIVIDNYADAIYINNNDTLYFKRLTTITSIFKGIDELYKEATQEETASFLENDFIHLTNDYCAEYVKTANRKRIAMARETFSKFTSQEKLSIFSYVREYCEDLTFDENAENFSIAGEDDLKKLLYGIEQRYYTTPIGNEKRLANSIMTL